MMRTKHTTPFPCNPRSSLGPRPFGSLRTSGSPVHLVRNEILYLMLLVGLGISGGSIFSNNYFFSVFFIALPRVAIWRRQWQPTPVLLPGKSHGRRSLVGCSLCWTRLSNFTLTFHFHALEMEMATHSSVLAWRIPGTGEPGGLPSMGSHRVGHD